ncbi:unnamed protein product [Vitrella brassicaformis CCMP3155]|uniref:Uncharacterized protein n=1 Tax=Vitrella brassicaformis (strain CCMP3155) TaxID=1169540 RepID=A0A0G4EUK7_VITBC|nr:unnamed protein product [Vitrella brassicaformis CCMP3155]|eukprot:CEM02118.1 unnamed protein product [Vitrella brassicaformis CCMP3155]
MHSFPASNFVVLLIGLWTTCNATDSEWDFHFKEFPNTTCENDGGTGNPPGGRYFEYTDGIPLHGVTLDPTIPETDSARICEIHHSVATPASTPSPNATCVQKKENGTASTALNRITGSCRHGDEVPLFALADVSSWDIGDADWKRRMWCSEECFQDRPVAGNDTLYEAEIVPDPPNGDENVTYMQLTVMQGIVQDAYGNPNSNTNFTFQYAYVAPSPTPVVSSTTPTPMRDPHAGGNYTTCHDHNTHHDYPHARDNYLTRHDHNTHHDYLHAHHNRLAHRNHDHFHTHHDQHTDATRYNFDIVRDPTEHNKWTDFCSGLLNNCSARNYKYFDIFGYPTGHNSSMDFYR